MPTASLIIPVHNRRDTTLACLRHLRTLGAIGRYACIVVDDGSVDYTGSAVRREFPEVTVLTGDGNLWWTGAIALGSLHAFARGATVAVWLNDDCLPEPGALEHLLAHIAKYPGTVTAPACFDARSGQPVATGFKGRQLITVRSGEAMTVDGLSGFCLAVPLPVWEQLGPPDARRFPHYAGDTAYTLRASRAGFQVMLLGSARVQLTDHHPDPHSPALLLRAGRGLKENYQAVFLSKKSPFRLTTQWHLLRLKYGPIIGAALTGLRGLAWHLRFVLGF